MSTEIEERRIEVDDLRVGMYVCRLDRSWEGTPFKLQGLRIKSDDDINAFRDLCQFVYIDAERQISDEPVALRHNEFFANYFDSGALYSDNTSFNDELPRVRAALEAATTLVDQIFEDVTSGCDLSVEHVEKAVRPLVASVLRSADAFFWLEGLREHDSYSYGHAISCSALAAAFGRHLSFAEDTIISLAAGGMLMDIGKCRLPEELMRFEGALDPARVKLIRSHVAHGLEIVGAAGITDPVVLDIMRTHHERDNGTGYPARLSGAAIPFSGRILGIVDSYDAMISVRPYRAAISRHHAMRQLYASRDSLFQGELVEQFQVCLGVYPTGSLVELSSGEVAVVMAQNHVRRLRPRVVILSTALKQPVFDFRVIDLMEQVSDKPTVEIVRSLATGAYGLDTAELFLN